MRIDALKVADANDDRQYTAQQVINALDGNASSRLTVTATYQTTTDSPTVYYTALDPVDGSVITPRTTISVTLDGAGLYEYQQTRATDFAAVWDEGDPSDYVIEYILVGS